MKITNTKIIDVLNEIIDEWNDSDYLDLNFIDSTTDLSKIEKMTYGTLSFQFGRYPTKLSEHPVAYETTDEGAQGSTEFYYNEDGESEFILEVYDALPNYATITIYQ